MSDTHFCSDLTRRSREPLAGTAPFADHFVFITWPKRNWGYEALDSIKEFPGGLKNWSREQSADGKKITIRLASRGGMDPKKVSVFFYPENREVRGLEAGDLPECLDRWISESRCGKTYGEWIEKNQVFVCTHGRHDRCCAKFGQTVYKKLRDQTNAENLEIEVWEASHLGGHRFAANLMLLPQGHFHGHLTEDMIPAFLEAWKSERIHASSYRGHSFTDGPRQVAEAQLVQYCSQQGWNVELNLETLHEDTGSEFRCRVSLNPLKGAAFQAGTEHQHQPHRLEAKFRVMEFGSPGACDALDDVEQRRCWVINDVKLTE